MVCQNVKFMIIVIFFEKKLHNGIFQYFALNVSSLKLSAFILQLSVFENSENMKNI